MKIAANIVDKDNFRHTNSLIHENSPYLLQHAHNPVNWFPWGDTAHTKARTENKLLIISIGYAACHWCHVMAHESFEDPEVAQIMNDLFVPIKIDREERPDIDLVYMQAVHLLTGSGGWPLNCIALPDGRPIYGGTYFSKSQWIETLKQIALFAKEYPDKTEQQAAALVEGIRSNTPFSTVRQTQPCTRKDLADIVTTWRGHLDMLNGGIRGTPKFPLPCGYQFLLHYHYLTNDQEALQAVTTTLTKMAHGGIYDQIGGGFARYATDAFWQIPHFEKMLYDNAQLISLYAAAYQETRNPLYKKVITETLAFVKREMTAHDGTFYASLDADSEGKEGTFYVWTKRELSEITGELSAVASDYYSITDLGNWEQGTNILFRLLTDAQLAQKHNLTTQKLSNDIATINAQLLASRSKRKRPGLDTKILTGWNSLMVKAYIDAYRVLGDERYLTSALTGATVITRNIMQQDGRLTRTYTTDKATTNGFLDDYACTIDACIACYQATFNEQWLTAANLLTEYVLDHFFCHEKGLFYYTDDNDPALITRSIEIPDNVIPSGNSQMARNLLTLGSYNTMQEYVEKAEGMIIGLKAEIVQGGIYYANWASALATLVCSPCEVAIVGNNAGALRHALNKHYLPQTLLYGGNNAAKLLQLQNKQISGETMIYVCHKKTCRLPVTDVDAAVAQINKTYASGNI